MRVEKISVVMKLCIYSSLQHLSFVRERKSNETLQVTVNSFKPASKRMYVEKSKEVSYNLLIFNDQWIVSRFINVLQLLNKEQFAMVRKSVHLIKA